MRVGYLVLGMVAYSGLPVVLGILMTLVARWVAKLLGGPPFRWFSEPVPSVPAWKLNAARGAAIVAPWCVSVVLFWSALLVNGTPSAPTTRIDVLEGPARQAGVQSGDRVLAIGGRPVSTWEALRLAVPKEEQPTTVSLERGGRQLELQVTPLHGRIGVAPHYEIERLGVVGAAVRALPMPFSVARQWIASFVDTVALKDQADLRGPVSIVKETSAAQSEGSLLMFVGIISAYVSIFVSALPVVDGLSSWIFRMRYRDVDRALRAYQLERMRQALVLVYFTLVVGLLGGAMGAVGLAFSFVPLLIALPFVWAIYPLLWVGGQQVWRKRSVVIVLGVSLVVPCAVLLAGFDLMLTLRRAIDVEGYRVGWWRIQSKA